MKHSYVLSRNCLKLTPALLGLILVQNLLVQNLGLALLQTWVRIPALLLTSSVTLGSCLTSVCLLCAKEIIGRLNVTSHGVQYQALNKCLVK